MLIGCAAVLIAAAVSPAEPVPLAEVPPLIASRLASTNEVRGVFAMEKFVPDATGGRTFRSRGEYRIRPGRDFTWRTLEPFETTFTATPTNYVYANEDETVTRRLRDLPGVPAFADVAKGDYSAFFRCFDALYREEPDGRFFLKARPKVRDLARRLARIDVEGVSTNWTLRAEFPGRTAITVRFEDRDF